jgi:predicted nuclease with TOPRIM domain
VAEQVPSEPVETSDTEAAKPDAAENATSNQNADKSDSDDAEPKDRFDALVRDRDSLRAEVTDMRKSLEEIQSKHQADMEALQQKLDDSESKKEQAETQFQKLMERVNAIKSQLGQRLKEDEVRDPVSISPSRKPYSRYAIGGIGSSAIPDRRAGG